MPAGDHLYRMDYRDFVKKHRDSGAAITIAALPCAEKEATAFGLMKIDSAGRVGAVVGIQRLRGSVASIYGRISTTGS
jgi:ADP-glucose pyrophosphorylase